ncbi:hypothetical protein C9374_012501 [Naegleria lovaniensis]|uniref:WAPL domain-containing protein n=1 Tax=Naegleria lovaniensis TaxID=51637 RepID=A0AA88GX93_NAELO|nr:uncharacterized protein C9374_012501 [Naegleria lovaniensis]KAG2392249.1 hypothetical protein C9374_012501 [Naegleria lovaniensis]
MRTFKKKNPVLVKVESSPNSKKVSLFKDINSDDEKKGKSRRKPNSNDLFSEDVFDETLEASTKRKRHSLDSAAKQSTASSESQSPIFKTPTKRSQTKSSSVTPTKTAKSPKTPGSSGKKKLSVEENFFADDLFDDVFDFSSSEDEDEEKTLKAAKKPKRASTSSASPRLGGKEETRKESILNYLEGLKSSYVDTQHSCASSLAKMFSEQHDDLGIFLRAHSLVKKVVDTLCLVIDFEKQKLLSLTASQIIGILMKDPLNAEYITENSFKILHEIIKQHYVLKWQQVSNLDSIKRTKRTRIAALKAGSPSKAQKQQYEEEDENMQGFEKTTISLALAAMVNIVNYEHNCFELKYHQASNKEEFLEKNRPNLLFIKTNSVETIERLVPCLLALLEKDRDDALVYDMCNCIKMLEKNGIVTKYSSDASKNAESWNYFLPALIRILNCLTPINKPLLSELKDGHPVVECALVTLRFLTNISNGNEQVCQRIAEENGLSGICAVLASSYTQHFDVITMCLALLANMTDKSWNNRELVRNFKLEFRGKTKKLLNFLIELFVEYYSKQEYNDDNNTENCITISDQDSQNTTAAEIVEKVNTEKKEKENQGASARSNLKRTEDNIITSYLAILLGCLCKEHEANKEHIMKELPEKSFISLIIALKAFVLYQSNASLLTQDTLDSVTKILKELGDKNNSQTSDQSVE